MLTENSSSNVKRSVHLRLKSVMSVGCNGSHGRGYETRPCSHSLYGADPYTSVPTENVRTDLDKRALCGLRSEITPDVAVCACRQADPRGKEGTTL